MNKQDYLNWIESLESKGLDESEIEQATQNYLDLPDNEQDYLKEENEE